MRSPFSRPSRGNDQMAACGRLGNPGTIQAPMLCVPKQFQMAVGRIATISILLSTYAKVLMHCQPPDLKLQNQIWTIFK
ncbi:hypothetical protein RYX36_004775, partial [Vicia faba]